MRWQRATSLAIQIDADGSGTIGRILSRLVEAGVRIDGNAKSGDTLRVLTADLDAARAVIRHLGLTSQEQEVAVIGLAEESGAIAQLLQDVAAAGLPITFIYAISMNRVVISAPDFDGLVGMLMKE